MEEYVGPREDLYKEPFACSDCRRRLGKNVQVGKKSGEKEHGGSEEQEGKVKKKTDGEGKRNDDGDVAMSG